MSKVLLIYPYFKPRRDRSVFRFPPLGLSYIASTLLAAGHDVHLLDCTFMPKTEALEQALASHAEVAGIYCMVTMLEDCQWLARQLRPSTKLMVAGGPLPTCDPSLFLDDFDVVVRGEGEATLVELLEAYASGVDLSTLPGLVFRKKSTVNGTLQVDDIFTPERPFCQDLDSLPHPARHLLPNDKYIQFGRKKYGYAITTVMSTRGCPYACEFCSNVIFGGSYRERSAANVVEEIEQALALGYDRISFADDVFTLRKKRLLDVCAEITSRRLSFYWECLARVDSLDDNSYLEMYRAGCRRVFFGIESGDDGILKLMNKKITVEQARRAVLAAHRAGLQVGAFFILFYPGESNATVLNTLRFATSLPLDYVGLTMPYPLPGTALYERVKSQIKRQWRPAESIFGSHVLIYNSQFSEAKMWFGIMKGHLQFAIRRRLGRLAPAPLRLFEKLTDWLFVTIK
ncbi:MAG: B12-binding domain-containing radical SAM protein [Acidobacteriaceae bacterium]